MEKGLEEKTGKPLAHWVDVLKKSGIEKHGQMISFLKKEHGFTHGFANFVAHKTRSSDAASQNDDDLVSDQYQKKESLKPLYDTLIEIVKSLGNDIEIVPKKASVSVRRNRQFVLIQPSTKTRIDLGLKLDDAELSGRLENSGPFGTMCTNRIQITAENGIDEEVKKWMALAYDQAG